MNLNKVLPVDRWNRWALVAFLALWLASCIRPPHPKYLLMQHGPTVVAIAALVVVQSWLAVSRISYFAILVFLTFHLVGARHLYTFVPYDDWLEPLLGIRITDYFGFQRNHYDRLVHFLFGLLIVVPSWRFSRRIFGSDKTVSEKGTVPFFLSESEKSGQSPTVLWWSAAVAFSIMMTASAMYEIIEWIVAMTQSELTAESYNGQQGDVWDPHWDMMLAGAGSLVGLLFIGVLRPLRRG
jgi:putative membrane protein